MKRRVTVASLEDGPSKLGLGGVFLFVSPTHMWGSRPGCPAERSSAISPHHKGGRTFDRVISSARLLSIPVHEAGTLLEIELADAITPLDPLAGVLSYRSACGPPMGMKVHL